MRWIYLSPHFDDAVLSCGGLIWEQVKKQTPVEIWTICAGDALPGPLSPLALECHQQWGLPSAEQVVAARRTENQDAAALVGAETVDFSIADCIYRRSLEGDLLYPEQVFEPIQPFDEMLDSEIAAALETELRPDDQIVSPLAIGGHVDHILTRRAAEKLVHPLWYYADIPYLLNNNEGLLSATNNLLKKLYPVTKEGLGHWLKGIAAYRSQTRMLFTDEEKMKVAISLYWENQRGIRLWHAS